MPLGEEYDGLDVTVIKPVPPDATGDSHDTDTCPESTLVYLYALGGHFKIRFIAFSVKKNKFEKSPVNIVKSRQSKDTNKQHCFLINKF